MSKKAVLAVTVAVAFMLGSAPAWARDKGAQGSGSSGGMKESLNLTSDQQAQMKALGAAHQKKAKPLQDQARVKIKELKALVAAKAGDDAINAKLAELKTVRVAMQELQASFMEQREKILTPEQRAKMALMRNERMGDRNDEKDGLKGKKDLKTEKDHTPDTKE